GFSSESMAVPESTATSDASPAMDVRIAGNVGHARAGAAANKRSAAPGDHGGRERSEGAGGAKQSSRRHVKSVAGSAGAERRPSTNAFRGQRGDDERHDQFHEQHVE